jgi:methylglutaconyl-CoA hydratase
MMKKYTTLILKDRAPGVLEIEMSRPEVFNAFDETMIEEMQDAFEVANNNPEIRVIVLSGTGKHFSAGADLQWMKRASTASEEWNLEDARKFAKMLSTIDQSVKPVVARIQGAALGGGFGLACVCDIAIAAEQASFAISEAKFGILPSAIGPYVINTVGKRQARRLALTTMKISANDALKINLVHEVTTLEQLDVVVDQNVTMLLASSPNAIKEIKQLFGQLAHGPVTPEVIELTARTISRVRGTEEAKEGFDAFLNKRAANWIPKA